MQPLSRNPPPDAARLSAMLWPALIAPAALLLMVTAALRSDSGLVLDALELLGASIIAGFLTALFVHRFGLAKSSGFWAGISWLIALGVPGAMVWVGECLRRELASFAHALRMRLFRCRRTS